MKTTVKALVLHLKRAIEIIENEYPPEQHADYKIPEMRRAVLNAELKLQRSRKCPASTNSH